MLGTSHVIDESKTNSLFMDESSMQECPSVARVGPFLQHWAIETFQSFGRAASPMLA